MRHGRFTLIELLVVVAIIAVIAAMLLPALTRAKETARTALCSGNQKQIGAVFMLFADDHDELLPPFSIKTKLGVHNDVWGWHEFIMYYTDGQFKRDADEAGYVGVNKFWTENIRHTAPNGHPIKAWGPSGQYRYHRGSILDCPSSRELSPGFGSGARWQDYNSIVRGLPSWDPLLGTDHKGKDYRRLASHDTRILVIDAGGSNPAGIGSNPADTTRWSDGIDRYPGMRRIRSTTPTVPWRRSITESL